jgi:DNA-binding CsgD family transcriptional regulator
VFHLDFARWLARVEGPTARARVLEQLSSARACSQAVGCPRCDAERALYSAAALARVDERAQARIALHEWEERALLDDDLHGLVRLHYGALSVDELEARAEGLRVALETAERLPYLLESLWIRLDLGRALMDIESAGALDVLRSAAALAHERGAGTVQELAERALRAGGVRTWRRGGAGMPLTKRELEVAELAASGATNREIAQSLFLSPKTVERHISNVLKKVGARNRTELAERLRDPAGPVAGSAR